MRYIIILVFACFLSGCFDYNEEFTFQEDGRVAVKIDFLASRQQGTRTDCSSFLKEFDFYAVRPITNDERKGCELSGVLEISKLQQHLTTRKQGDGFVSAKLTVIKEGYRLDVSLRTLKQGLIDEGLIENLASRRNILRPKIKQSELNWVVNAAQIFATNGSVNDERTTAKITIPLSEMVESNESHITRFVEFSNKPKTLFQRLFQ